MAAGRHSRLRSALSRGRIPPRAYKMEPPLCVLSFLPLPELPRGRTASPRRPPLSPVPPATSSRLPLLTRAPVGCAVAILDVEAASSPPACPPFRAVTTGGAFPPASSGVATTAPSPAGCCSSPVRRSTSPSPPSTSQRRPLLWLLLYFAGTLWPVPASPSSSSSTSPPAAPSAVPVRWPTSPSPPPALQRKGRPWPRLPSTRTPPVFVVVVVLSSFPGRSGVRSSVKPCCSSSVFRQGCCSPVVVFVLGSASSSVAPAVSRLRPRIATEVVPSPFASVVPEPSPPRPFIVIVPRLVAWW
uniref:Cell wall protein-like n=1 Tax=Oryza sativa subsp. japonica TaxID=39947 RepID=Q8H3S8_ORYSJ|nr:hypothetical protein [Oryza sativa Japonica Group]